MNYIYGFISAFGLLLYSDGLNGAGALSFCLIGWLITALIHKVYRRIRYGRMKTYRIIG